MGSSSRWRQILYAVLSGVVGKGMSTLSMILVVPMSINYLGKEGFGVMTTITSVVSAMAIANVGIGLGLQNSLTEAIALGRTDEIKGLVSTAFYALLALLCSLILLLAAGFGIVDWVAVFKAADSAYVDQVPSIVLISFLGVFGLMLNSLVSAIYAARQELHALNIVSGIAQLGVLAFVYLSISLDSGIVGVSMANVLALCFGPFLLSYGYLLIRKDRRLYLPSLAAVGRQAFMRIKHSAKNFFIIQICCILLFQLSIYMINYFSGSAEVTSYTVGQRLFGVLTTAFTLVLAPMWPAYGNAVAQRDFGWIESSHRKIVAFFLLFIVATAAGVAIAGDWFFEHWVGSEAKPDTLLVWALFAYFAIKQWTDVHAILINGLDKIGVQAISASIHAAITVGVSWILGRDYGCMGVVVGGILGYAMVSAWYLPWYANRVIKQMKRA